jgi:hypothetical protein
MDPAHEKMSTDVELLPKGIDLATLEQSMRPGELSQQGFLAPEQSLMETIEGDKVIVASLGLTHAALADALEEVLEQSLQADAAPSLI